MTTNKELRELAEGVKHWGSSIADAWPSDPDSNDTWSAGAIDEDGNKYPVIEVDADQYDAPGDSERLARFFTAANPATVLALLDAYEALQAECERWKRGSEIRDEQNQDLHSFIMELKAECEELRTALAESRANDLTAMGYLNQIRQLVGGDDFQDMVRRCERLQAKCARLQAAMIEAKGHINHYMYGGSSYREPAAKAIKLIDDALQEAT